MRLLVCLVLAVASVTSSLTTIGEVSESSFVSQHDDALTHFIQTAEPPRMIMGVGFERAMGVDEHFANSYGAITLDESSVFSKETIMGMVQDPSLLVALGYGDHEVFNGTELTAIVSYLNAASTNAQSRSAAQKQCYCHFMGGHDTDDTEDESEDEDTDDADIPKFYAALLVGANQEINGINYNPGHQIFTPTTTASQELTRTWNDYKICTGTDDPDNGFGQKTGCTAGSSTSTPYKGCLASDCEDACAVALHYGTIANNGKFWGAAGCPYQGNFAVASSTVRSIQQTSFHLHQHVRELEEMKVFSVLTRSNDKKSFCENYGSHSNRNEVQGVRTRGSLLQKSCEERFDRFMELTNGDLIYSNSHLTSLRACEAEKFCAREVGLKATWPRLIGERCDACMTKNYLAALNYESLERRGMKVSTKSFCQFQRKVHPYLEEPMQDYECETIIQNYLSSRDATNAAVTSCVDSCSYAAPVGGTFPLREVSPDFLARIKSISA